MAVKTGTVVGISLLMDAPLGGLTKHAHVTFSMPAFGSSDTGTLAVAAAIQSEKRNGKTVTLRSACRGIEGNGLYAGTNTAYFTASEAVSSGNITFNMTNQTGTQIASPNTGSQSVGANPGDLPLSIIVAYDEA